MRKQYVGRTYRHTFTLDSSSHVHLHWHTDRHFLVLHPTTPHLQELCCNPSCFFFPVFGKMTPQMSLWSRFLGWMEEKWLFCGCDESFVWFYFSVKTFIMNLPSAFQHCMCVPNHQLCLSLTQVCCEQRNTPIGPLCSESQPKDRGLGEWIDNTRVNTLCLFSEPYRA